MAEKTLKMIRIKWVRSGIAFPHQQKTIVRSLGLNKLNHIVVRPDTPQIRGIVAAVPHMLKIVPEQVAPAWASIPEYTIHAAAPVPNASAEPAETETAVPEVKSASAGKENESSPEGSEPAQAGKE